MAKIVARIYGGEPKITSFEFDEVIFGDINIKLKKFYYPTEEWALFVLNNRDRKFMDVSSL